MTAFRRASAVGLVLAVVLTGCGGDEDPTIEAPASTAPTSAAAGASSAALPDTPVPTFNFTVRGGTVEGPSQVRVTVNRPLALRVTSDTEDEVHVHGYELRADVGPGKVAEIEFAADIHGQFEVELERSRRRLTTVSVEI